MADHYITQAPIKLSEIGEVSAGGHTYNLSLWERRSSWRGWLVLEDGKGGRSDLYIRISSITAIVRVVTPLG